MPAKDAWKKFWHFIWHEDSIASWIANIVIAFILIKFILYPGLGFVLGTDFPVVAVVSSSMEHQPRNFNEWWGENEDFYLKYNITKFDFQAFPFRNGFNKGDIMILSGVDASDVELGEVIVYWSGKPYPIIHRYIGRNGEYLMSKGDNNDGLVIGFDLNEMQIQENQVLGKASLRIPYLGWVKILAVNLVQCTLGPRDAELSYPACLIEGVGTL